MTSAFSDFNSFWRMGGYAAFVWSAYGIVFLVLVFRILIAKQKFNRLRRSLYQKYVKSS